MWKILKLQNKQTYRNRIGDWTVATNVFLLNYDGFEFCSITVRGQITIIIDAYHRFEMLHLILGDNVECTRNKASWKFVCILKFS